ncbi:unnamed protein product [Urochloa decumbens]|uniref:DUF6598 domain-containing protein n=1 Tax=Urochloa decumbens TaxID=240449 RepID=A0ABC9F8C7_9POAL
MSICVDGDDPWAEMAAEFPSLVEDIETEDENNLVKTSGRSRGTQPLWNQRRQLELIRNRNRQEKAIMEELMKKSTPPRDDDAEDEDCDEGRTLDEDEADLEEMLGFRHTWERGRGLHYYGCFEDNTSFRPMRYTEGTIPGDARSDVVLEILSVQVTETKDGLDWPLHVYGHIVARDVVDQNRNLLFDRKRDNCQILTQQDSCLLLTGPSRAVMIIDPVTFEVDLKAKGKTESEDKVLSLKAFKKRVDDFILLYRCFSKRCTVEFAFAVVSKAVEATVYSVKVISGSWPNHLRGQVVSHTTRTVQKDIVLLDSQDGRMPITSDGTIELSRSVVSVALREELTICVLASQVADKSDVIKEAMAYFTPQRAGWSHCRCDLGFCELEITIAWSLFTVMADQKSRMRAVILNRFRH